MGRFASLLALALTLLAACDDGNAVKEPSPNASPTTTPGTDGGPPGADGGPDGGPGDCFPNPRTYYELINACTDAQRIAKNPTLPRLLADGGLPPL